MKHIIVVISLMAAISMASASVRAEEGVCVTQYGGSTVCGARTPEIHAPVNAGLADINFSLVGAMMLAVGGITYVKSRRSLTA